MNSMIQQVTNEMSSSIEYCLPAILSAYPPSAQVKIRWDGDNMGTNCMGGWKEGNRTLLKPHHITHHTTPHHTLHHTTPLYPTPLHTGPYYRTAPHKKKHTLHKPPPTTLHNTTSHHHHTAPHQRSNKMAILIKHYIKPRKNHLMSSL